MNQRTDLLMTIQRTGKLYEAMLKRVCGQYGLTAIEAKIIGFLKNNPSRDTAGDIVELRMLAKGNVSQAVDSLIQKGFLERRQDQADRRRIHLALLPSAQPAAEEIDGVWSEFERCAFAGFSGEERRQYEEWSRRIMENIRARSERE